MYTLGIWGGSADRPHETSHDTGAAIVQDGKVIAAVNEERMSRVKVDTLFPFAAIDECLKIAGLDFNDIDRVAMVGGDAEFEWKGKSRAYLDEFKRGGHNLSTKLSLLTRSYQAWKRSSPKLGAKYHHQRVAPEALQNKPLDFVEHHHAHAATAFLCGPFEKAVILTLDGSDSAGGAGLVGVGDSSGMQFVDTVLETNSLALLYAQVTKLLGFRPLRHEGKVLGLAAFDDPKKLRPKFDARGGWKGDGWWHIPGFTLDISRKKPPYIEQTFAGDSREAIAAALQDFVEEMVCKKVQQIYADHPEWEGLPLVTAGGLFANVKLNQRLLALQEVSNIYIHQNMGDGGLCTGAALFVDARERNDWTPTYMPTAYLGTDVNPDNAGPALEEKGLAFEPADLDKVAQKMADGYVIARAQGAMEYGPRALGNRSILACADDPAINQWLNDQLERSEFMPFAPMVLAEYAEEYFPDYKPEHYAARFMTITYDASERAKKEIPAAIHVDGTARPQVVYKEDNPELHALITAYYNKTGKPSVINTSFNMHEEPIVRSAEESIRAAQQANLNGLLIGGLWVELKPLQH